MTAQGGLHDGLSRHVGAKAHVREHVQAQNVIACKVFVARKDHPADTVARDHMRFGKARERHAEQIGRQRGNRGVLQAVHNQAVVDFIREDDQLVFTSDVNDLLKDLGGVQGAGGVVRIDDDDGLGTVVHLAFDVVDVGVPLRLLVADVMNRRAAGKRCACGPKRVVGRGDKDLVAAVQ